MAAWLALLHWGGSVTRTGISSVPGLMFHVLVLSAWQMAGQGSIRTVKTKSYLNSLSLLTVSGFIHRSMNERSNPWHYAGVNPGKVSDFTGAVWFPLVRQWPCSLPLFQCTYCSWRHAGHTTLRLLAGSWLSGSSPALTAPEITEVDGDGLLPSSVSLPGPRKGGHQCYLGWKRRVLRHWTTQFPICMLSPSSSIL